jgi:hypothetical protein
MATYKGIKGFSIQNLSADPSNPIEGEMWYNSTSNVWKVEEATTAGAWASGGNINSTRIASRRCRNTNGSIKFWWKHFHQQFMKQQQKNMMVLLGLQIQQV